LTGKIAAIIAGAILAAGALVAGAIIFTSDDDTGRADSTSEGSADQAPKPLTRDQWQEKVLAAGARQSTDWDALEALVETDCSNTADDWALRLSLTGATPAIDRAGLEYKCPEKVAAFDEGQEQLQSSIDKVDRLCNAPYDTLSPEDQEWVDAVCVP